MKKYYPEKAGNFVSSYGVEILLSNQRCKNYLKCCEDYVKKEVKDDADKLNSVAVEIKENFDDDAKQ